MSFSPRTRLRSPRVVRGFGAAVAMATLAALTAGCSGAESVSAGTAPNAAPVSMTDQWIKAAESGMSAAFGNLRNTGDAPVTLVAATSPASQRVEIHEVVPDSTGTKTMRPKQGGITIPANGEVTLKPGADHLMFMDLVQPLRTGAQTTITLTFADGQTLVVTAQVRDFAGGKENYAPGTESPSHSG
ncbi:copper chaperone PCu(A)C [Nocardia coubleae]|uniref:Copper chaperone PCu(A)C n=1 Tax=Nocardia coubleae TaxID=356147 RepID=A0A846W027_9NOCA|nr:copper chaperone PCu(A)C [Nocardia coubleae]